jgi:hypothetical protein
MQRSGIFHISAAAGFIIPALKAGGGAGSIQTLFLKKGFMLVVAKV